MSAHLRPRLGQPRHCSTESAYLIMTAGDQTITLRPAPDREPPFDDELHHPAPEPPDPMQPALPFPPSQLPVRHRIEITAQSARRAAVGDPADMARRLLVGLIEVAASHRPMHQLAKMLSPALTAGLSRDLCPVPPRQGPQHRLLGATVLGVRSSEPTDGVAEVCATLHTQKRVHAAALRLEIRRGQWICTRLIIG